MEYGLLVMFVGMLAVISYWNAGHFCDKCKLFSAGTVTFNTADNLLSLILLFIGYSKIDGFLGIY